MNQQISKIFIEIVVAPSFSEEALAILTQKKNIRLLELPGILSAVPMNAFDMKKVLGGLLIQDFDRKVVDEDAMKVVTTKAPTQAELDDMIFAMKVVKHTKSNAIVIAKDKTILGIGGGQVNRIWPTEQAIAHSLSSTKGAVLASDAFFPVDDYCAQISAKAGISAIMQPGGSVNDEKFIESCNNLGLSMVFTGLRHFKH